MTASYQSLVPNKALIEYNINGNKSYSSGLTNTQTASNFTNTTLNNAGVSTSDTNLINSSANNIGSNLISQGTIQAGDDSNTGNVVIVAGNNINNIGSKITSTGSTLLEATDGDINITTAQLRDRTKTSWGSRKKGGTSTADNTTNLESEITSGDNLYITASSSSSTDAGDINIKGSKLTSANNTEITAENDVNIEAAKDVSYSESQSWKKKTFGRKSSSSKTTKITQVESELSTTNNGDITITSGSGNTDTIGSDGAKGNLTIVASKLTITDADNDSANNAGDGDINLTARNNVTISSDFNSEKTEIRSKSSGFLTKKNSTEITTELTNVSSEISSSNDINITSGNDIDIIASNLSGNSANIVAGKYLDNDTSSSTYNTEIFNKNGDVNILNAKDSLYKYNQSTKVKIGLDVINPTAIALLTTGNFVMAAMASVEQNASSTIKIDYAETNIASKLNFSKDINLSSGGDINIRASKLSSGIDAKTGEQSGNQGNINLFAGYVETVNFNDSIIAVNTNDNASVSISADSLETYSTSEIQRLSMGGDNISFDNDSLNYGAFKQNESIAVKNSNVSSSLVSNNGNINILAQKNINLEASNLATAMAQVNQSNSELGQINLISNKGSVNISSAFDTEYSKSESLAADLYAQLEITSHESSLKLGLEGSGNKSDEKISNVVSSNIIGSSVNIISGSSLDSSNASSDQGNININSSNIYSSLGSVYLESYNGTNLTTSSNLYNKTESGFNFDANASIGVTYNFKDVWQSVEDLKDVKVENAIKYLGISAVSGYLGAGSATPYIATYAPLMQSVMEGDSFDESLAENQDYLRDANIINNAGKGGSGSASASFNLAYSQSKTGYEQNSVIANNIIANSGIDLTSLNSNLSIASSNMSASLDINLKATKGDIDILANADAVDYFSRSFSSSGSYALVGKGGSVNFSFSKIKSESETQINSNLSAGGDFNLNSGGDTNIISSNILASDVNMVVVGDLSLESRQNTSSSKSMSFGIGGGLTLSKGGNSGGGNLSYSKSTSERNWVDNQASILGTNSVTINV